MAVHHCHCPEPSAGHPSPSSPLPPARGGTATSPEVVRSIPYPPGFPKRHAEHLEHGGKRCAVVKTILKLLKSMSLGKLKSSSVKEECCSAWAPAGTQLGDPCVRKRFFSSEQAELGKLSGKLEKAGVHLGWRRGCGRQGRPPTPRLTRPSPLRVAAKRVRAKRTEFRGINIYSYADIYMPAYRYIHSCIYMCVCMSTYINHLFLLSLVYKYLYAHMCGHIHISRFPYV